MEPAIIITDSELRELFRDESREYLEQLEQGLLQLEQDPQDKETLDAVFRAAHSLKGAARIVEVTKVEVVAHHFEETLGTARRGAIVLTTAIVDRLYQAVDSIRDYCDEAITGKRVVTDPETVLRRLTGEEAAPPAQSPTNLPEPTESPQPSSPVLTAADASLQMSEIRRHPKSLVAAPTRALSTDRASEPAAKSEAPLPASPAEYAIDTVRVPSLKLDALMSQAGELAVTRSRIAHRVTQVEQLLSCWEQWNRDSHTVRSLSQTTNVEIAERGLEQLREYLHSDRDRLGHFGSLLKQLEAAVRGDDARVDLLASQLEDGIRSIRLLPLSTIFNLFTRMVRDLARTQEKEVEFTVEGGETAADKRILEELKDPLTHMIRNSMDHGIETPGERETHGKPRQATLLLRAHQRGPSVVIEITDDGAGIDIEAVKRVALKRHIATPEELAEMSDAQSRNLIFAPGFSTKPMVTDLSGRGVGMDVVRANVERLRGSIQVDSSLGQGTTIRLVLPLTVATRRVMIVAVSGYKFAIPVEQVQTCRLVRREEVFPMQGRGTIMLGGEPVTVVRLSDLLELPQQDNKWPGGDQPERTERYLECIIIRVDEERIGFLVDELLDEQEVVLKAHGPILRRVRNVSGSTILETGEVCVTLNPHDLIRSAQAKPAVANLETTLPVEARKKVILLAEDSLVTRTQEKRILESAGFAVVTAVDGQDAYNKLSTCEFDAVVSDVEMPNLSGLDLAAKIRSQPQYKNLPVILVTSLSSDEDRKRGMEVGADAYLTKPGFDQSVFLETVKRFA